MRPTERQGEQACSRSRNQAVGRVLRGITRAPTCVNIAGYTAGRDPAKGTGSSLGGLTSPPEKLWNAVPTYENGYATARDAREP